PPAVLLRSAHHEAGGPSRSSGEPLLLRGRSASQRTCICRPRIVDGRGKYLTHFFAGLVTPPLSLGAVPIVERRMERLEMGVELELRPCLRRPVHQLLDGGARRDLLSTVEVDHLAVEP